jgi:hypothetical protein
MPSFTYTIKSKNSFISWSGSCLSGLWSHVNSGICEIYEAIKRSGDVVYKTRGPRPQGLGGIVRDVREEVKKVRNKEDIFQAVTITLEMKKVTTNISAKDMKIWTEAGGKILDIPQSENQTAKEYFKETALVCDPLGPAWFQYLRMCWYRMPSLVGEIVSDFAKAYAKHGNTWSAYLYTRSLNGRKITGDYRIFPLESCSGLTGSTGINSQLILEKFKLQDITPTVGLLYMLEHLNDGKKMKHGHFKTTLLESRGSFKLHAACRATYKEKFGNEVKVFVRGGPHIFKSGLEDALQMRKKAEIKKYVDSENSKLFTERKIAGSGMKCMNYIP